MTTTSSSDNDLKAAGTIPFPDLARVSELNGTMFSETAKFNAQVSTTLQNLGQEWTEFVGARLREDVQLFRTVHDCRSLQDLQHAYAQFWQTAFTQYGDEAQRMLRITQGAMTDATHKAQEMGETLTAANKAA
ncbi:hypothetical protein BH10PSE10_BH10PSE10_13970 [soil metagenome]